MLPINPVLNQSKVVIWSLAYITSNVIIERQVRQAILKSYIIEEKYQ